MSPAQLARDLHRHRHRPAQLLRGPRDRPVRRVEQISLAIVLIIGFGLHNATEGLGICAPLAGDKERPSWGFLALLGLIGGGPTFLGTSSGQAWVSEAVSILFFALAAGSILYVVMELLNVGRALAPKTLVTWGIMLGLFLGFATDFILVAAGA